MKRTVFLPVFLSLLLTAALHSDGFSQERKTRVPAVKESNMNLLEPPADFSAVPSGNDVYLSWDLPAGTTRQWVFYHDRTFESSFASTDGGAGLAQLFSAPAEPDSLLGIRFFTTNFENWDQPLEVYVLSGDGTTVLGGPYAAQGANNNWVSVSAAITLEQAAFMIATYNTGPEGPYVGVDESYYDGSLYFGHHADGFTELSQLGNWEYTGSHEALITFKDAKGVSSKEWIRPENAANLKSAPDHHAGRQAGEAAYPEGTHALQGYNIYRDGSQINNSNWFFTNYKDAGLANGTYEYEVTAVYEEGESPPTQSINVIVNDLGLDRPVNLSGYATDDLVVELSWDVPGLSEEELIYDLDAYTGSYIFPGYTMSTHMSPSGPCQLVTLRFFTETESGENVFRARVFDWAGSQPGTDMLFDKQVAANDQSWTDVDISGEEIFVEGDFVVGFGSVNEDTYLAYDADYNNGRSWDYEEAGSSWTSYEETYLIRAVVLYDGLLQAETGSSKGLLGYKLYRDFKQIDEDTIVLTTYTDTLPAWGTYTYNVKAVYDEGESAFSDEFVFGHYFGIREVSGIDASIYPNPSSGFVNIDSEEEITRITLRAIDGRVLLSVEEPGENIRLNTGELNSGIYLVELHTVTASGVYKLLVR